ncbi:MAG: GMC family oxidoreductase N-terminal domain-containing protein [Bacteroidetes bacterium]|nr:GMC family oxidoreductase N-terminal domain-containing protein [Bacteroidota bacterium]
MKKQNKKIYDYVIIGSGFGGAVSALRLSEKGYKVLVIEKGKAFNPGDFPKTNWNLRKWLWVPFLRFFGFFKITYFKHIGVLSGVGVGGGSLVYANALPVPKSDFFESKSWSHLNDWEDDLKPFYDKAKNMLGVASNPRFDIGDKTLKSIAVEYNKESEFKTTEVAVYFNNDEKECDPYFDGGGPLRKPCTFCGHCMIGCNEGAKNTLDKNYLYFARKHGAEILPEHKVHSIKPIIGDSDTNLYEVCYKSSTKIIRKGKSVYSKGIVFAGGVLGTIPLLLKLKKTTLPNLSDMIGRKIRTNSESLLGITTPGKKNDFSEGIAISSIFHTDDYSHVEPVRYPAGSGFWRLALTPMIKGGNVFQRTGQVIFNIIKQPVKFLKTYFVDDWAKRTQILLFMRTIDSTLTFKKGMVGMKSSMDEGDPPSAFIPEALEIAEKFAERTGGLATALVSESLLGIPTTAHILGGAVMGDSPDNGVIDKDNKIFGYDNMYVCDGSMISANPGVNPSLTITAITERAMSKIPQKDS